jgi:molybdopterin-guanine dinucleotide biosynthesis protein A
MGSDKAFLRLGSLTLLEHMITIAKEVCDNVALIGDRQRLAPYGRVIEDQFAGQGLLAGIHAALTSASAKDLNLVLAVDLPKVSIALLKYLLNAAAETSATVTVPYSNGFSQPLCAVYRKEFAAIAETALLAGRNKIDPLFATAMTRKIDEAEIAKLGFSPSIFDNVNTPEDWQRLQQSRGAAHE